MEKRKTESNKERKTRSDKKRDVKPTVHISLYENIDRLSYITNKPMKDIAEYLCIRGMESRKVVETLRPRFRRDLLFRNTLLRGDMNLPPERVLRFKGNRKRVPIRFKQETHDKLSDLAYALDLTVSSATALLLDTSLKNMEFLDQYLAKHVAGELNNNKKEQLKEVLRYIRKDNPFPSDEVTFRELLAYVVEEAVDYTRNAIRGVRKITLK